MAKKTKIFVKAGVSPSRLKGMLAKVLMNSLKSNVGSLAQDATDHMRNNFARRLILAEEAEAKNPMADGPIILPGTKEYGESIELTESDTGEGFDRKIRFDIGAKENSGIMKNLEHGSSAIASIPHVRPTMEMINTRMKGTVKKSMDEVGKKLESEAEETEIKENE